MITVMGIFTPSINYAATGAISGRVTDSHGLGIEKVLVFAHYSNNMESTGNATTDSSGNFTITGLPTGSYRLYFNARSVTSEYYASEWYNDKSDFDSANPVVVTAPATTSNVNAVLAPGGTISGKVTDKNGQGIDFLVISLFNSKHKFLKYSSALTDTSGKYTVTCLSSGTYYVKFGTTPSHSGYLTEWYNNKTDLCPADPVIVMAPNTTSNINAVLNSGGTISGKVTNDHGLGIEKVLVYAYDSNTSKWNFFSKTSFAGYFLTDSSGNYAITGLPTGSYRLYFSSCSSALSGAVGAQG
jgi:protocatechuate 3,4-dioxygenase beta subunit